MKITVASLGIWSWIPLAGLVAALPQPAARTQPLAPQSAPQLFSRQSTSPDGTCGLKESGANKGYRCASVTPCCSQWGWCGSTAEYCGTGCQSGYGTCTGTTTPPPATTSKPPTTTAPPTTSSRPRLGSVPYGVTITSCTVPGTVALTFDDGPYIYTQQLLTMLNAKGAKATFFMNGANWGAPITTDTSIQQVMKNVYNSGHQIASHTWSHPDLDDLDAASIKSEMNQLESAFLSIIGRYPTYMRPPYLDCGSTCLSTMNTLGYHVISTNLDTLDWQYNTDATNYQSQQIFNSAISSTSGTTGKWLVLSHDVHDTTVRLLAGYMIDTAKAKGYKLVTVGECLGDPVANWYRTTL